MPVNKLLNLPYGSYLMVRLDYVIICGNELEAKILRIIEMYMEDERRILYKELLNDPKNAIEPEATVEVTKDVWAAISHRLFKNDLYDQDMSENTLRRALKSLVKKRFIRVRDDRTKRYEAPKYQINTDVVQGELDTLSKLGKTEYQKLMVSKIDGIKNASYQKVTPADHQNLTPSSNSRVSKFDPNSRRVTDLVDRLVEEDTDANASTRAGEEDTPYVPVFDLPQRQAIQELSPVLDEKIEQVDEQRASLLSGSQPIPPSPEQDAGYEKPGAATSQPRTRAESRKSKRGQNKDTFKVYFSVEGAAFRAWYEEIFETKLDETAANARACNALGKRESVTYENVQFVRREIDLNKWARENNVVPTPQDLAREDGNIRWEKWLQSAQKRAKQPQRAQPKGDNNLADWVAESERKQAQISPEESARRTEEARRKLAAVQQQIAAQKAAERQKQTVHYRVKGESYA